MATSDPLRCAVVGMGDIGGVHAGILGSLPDAELVATCDLDAERERRSPEGPAFTTDVSEVLDDDSIEAVWLCTPPEAHRELAVTALGAGKHVFCEKPIATRLGDADAMVAAAAHHSDRVLAIGHTLRFHPDYLAAHEHASNGNLGQLVQLSARWITGDHEGRALSGHTSVALEMAIHDVDVLRWLAGDVHAVSATASAITPCGDGPDSLVATVELASGAVATLEHGWILPSATHMESDHRLAVFGSLGTAYVDLQATPTRIFGAHGPRFPRTTYRPGDGPVAVGALATMDRHFLATIRGGPSWPVPLADARAALAVALAMELSAAQRRRVEIAEIEADA